MWMHFCRMQTRSMGSTLLPAWWYIHAVQKPCCLWTAFPSSTASSTAGQTAAIFRLSFSASCSKSPTSTTCCHATSSFGRRPTFTNKTKFAQKHAQRHQHCSSNRTILASPRRRHFVSATATAAAAALHEPGAGKMTRQTNEKNTPKGPSFTTHYYIHEQEHPHHHHVSFSLLHHEQRQQNHEHNSHNHHRAHHPDKQRPSRDKRLVALLLRGAVIVAGSVLAWFPIPSTLAEAATHTPQHNNSNHHGHNSHTSAAAAASAVTAAGSLFIIPNIDEEDGDNSNSLRGRRSSPYVRPGARSSTIDTWLAQSRDMSSDLIERFPNAANAGFGLVLGFVGGYGVKKASKVIVVTAGLIFVGAQALQHFDIVYVNWGEVGRHLTEMVVPPPRRQPEDASEAMAVSEPPAWEAAWKRLVIALKGSIAASAGFTVGFIYGLRAG